MEDNVRLLTVSQNVVDAEKYYARASLVNSWYIRGQL